MSIQLEYARSMFGDKYDKALAEGIKSTKEKWASSIKKISNALDNAKKFGQAEQMTIIDNKAILDKTYLLHNIPISDDIEGLENRKELGILASEWFGKAELYGEAPFCSSFLKLSNIQPRSDKKDKMITFIIDTSSKEMQELLHLDYFEYIRNKNKNDLSMYSQEELQLLAQLDEKASNKSIALQEPNWSAIPGGVPSKYIIGIMTDAFNIPASKNFIKKASEIFGVPVINSQLEVVYQNSMEQSNQAQDTNFLNLENNYQQAPNDNQYSRDPDYDFTYEGLRDTFLNYDLKQDWDYFAEDKNTGKKNYDPLKVNRCKFAKTWFNSITKNESPEITDDRQREADSRLNTIAFEDSRDLYNYVMNDIQRQLLTTGNIDSQEILDNVLRAEAEGILPKADYTIDAVKGMFQSSKRAESVDNWVRSATPDALPKTQEPTLLNDCVQER